MRRGLSTPKASFDHKPYCLNGLAPIFSTDHGALFKGDCVKILRGLADDTADLIFADPPRSTSEKSTACPSMTGGHPRTI